MCSVPVRPRLFPPPTSYLPLPSIHPPTPYSSFNLPPPSLLPSLLPFVQSINWILENDIGDAGLDLSFSTETQSFGKTERVELLPVCAQPLATNPWLPTLSNAALLPVCI